MQNLIYVSLRKIKYIHHNFAGIGANMRIANGNKKESTNRQRNRDLSIQWNDQVG